MGGVFVKLPEAAPVILRPQAVESVSSFLSCSAQKREKRILRSAQNDKDEREVRKEPSRSSRTSL